ncbi:MAG: DUF5107 domain-containing protein [Candidatus Latescibacteria bacterium]|nr:DUF5107 domain-containing protein [Candidatus Latescibacterota bacterium]
MPARLDGICSRQRGDGPVPVPDDLSYDLTQVMLGTKRQTSPITAGLSLLIILVLNGCSEAWTPADRASQAELATFSLQETRLVISQVDYEGAIYTVPDDPYPHLDVARVRTDRIIRKQHRAVVMENAHVKLTLLPEMGRVYSLIFKPAGHEVFWHNDIVTVGGGQHNPLGWWIWIGGAEYTLPGDEHGTTWAEIWAYRIVEDSEYRKAVMMSVTERGTGLEEHIEISLYPDRSFYEARIQIVNPTSETVEFAHWINPQWTPGGRNELTDNTEFIIPTELILIPDRFRDSLGESPQEWYASRLRFIKGWDRGSGDLMADGITHGFYGAYSHDEEEGVVRVFDKEKTPGVDIWTYGYRPTQPRGIPMGSGADNKGYAEMWGGTSRLYPDERRPIRPGETIAWTEWMYPFRGTGGLSYANAEVAVCIQLDAGNRLVRLGIDATRPLNGVQAILTSGADTLLAGTIDLVPGSPCRRTAVDLGTAPLLRIRLMWQARTVADVTLTRQEIER